MFFLYVRKLIVIHWISIGHLTLSAWKNLDNANVTLYKMTYGARRCPIKFGPDGYLWTQWQIALVKEN